MAKKAKKKPSGNRFEQLVDLQMEALQYWGEYAQNASRLVTKGSLHPAPWMEQYTELSKRVVEDLGKLVRIIAGNR